MGFGLPAIGTTSGAAGEIIADGVNGYLVPPNDPTMLADRLQNLATNRSKLGANEFSGVRDFSGATGWPEVLARVRQTLSDWLSTPAH